MPTLSELAELLRRPAMSWWDLLDITIVSLIVYELLKLIRGTRALPLAFGIALVVGLFYFSLGLRLDTVNWLIRNFVVYAAFATIVLLQSDIRRALIRLARAPLFRRFERGQSDDDLIEELVVATTALASKKTGGIIAIERSIGLLNFIEGGIPLDAKLTYDLLVSIFQPSAPLHDGAVIVQGDRVAAAACFLPLTVNPKLSRQLGSRHRAAIGLTEENDAVAIVISEETGLVSFIQDGGIDQGLDADRLRARLKEVLPLRRATQRREAEYALG